MFSIGVHPSPLPVGRGAAVLNWRIIDGGGPWGNSLFLMEDKTDKGDVLDFEPFEIAEGDDIRTVYDKVNQTTVTMLRRTIPRIAGGSVVRTPQDDSRATRYYKRTPQDGRVLADWNAEKICRYVRALTNPFPGAFLEIPGGRLSIWQAEPGDSCSSYGVVPGTVLEVAPHRGLRVAAGGGESVWFVRVTPSGGVESPADEWAAAAGLVAGACLIERSAGSIRV
jgi:methionyl-tRNA formyltransferase